MSVTNVTDVTPNVTRDEAGQKSDEPWTCGADDLRSRRLLPGQVDIDPERVKNWWHERAAKYQPPSIWNIGHVDHRLVAAFTVLLRLPIRTRPAEFGSSMPSYLYEWSDFLAQAEGDRELKRAGNRLIYRHKGATADEVAAMEQALAWPMVYVPRDTQAAQAVLLGAMWKAMEADADRKMGRLGIARRTFFYRRKRGLEAIAEGLIKARVVVT